MPKYITIPYQALARSSTRKHIANQDPTPTILALKKKRRDQVKENASTSQQRHSSFASQSSPTGIVDFEPRDSADGDVVASDGPATGSLGTFAIRSAIHGGVGEVKLSDILASESRCDGGGG